MSFGAILLLAVGLAMDATAVSAARGLAAPRILPRHVLAVALFFGGFQALMPLIGWLVGSQAGPWLETWDHWVAFVLLAGIGGKMLWEARHASEKPEPHEQNLFGWSVLLVLAIATSIDALAAGITLPMLGAPLVSSVVTIGVVTALASGLGLVAGRRLGHAFGRSLETLGGLVLIGLGLKILVQHLTS